MYDKDDAEAVMKRCRAGTKNYDEANGLHADCYGTIGGAVYEITTLRARCERAEAENEAWRSGHLWTGTVFGVERTRRIFRIRDGRSFPTINEAVDALLAEEE